MESRTGIHVDLIINRALRDGRRLPGTSQKIRNPINQFPRSRFLPRKQAESLFARMIALEDVKSLRELPVVKI